MKRNDMNASRREFLRQAGRFSALGVASPLALNLAALGSASAQSVSDYKAIVCIFLYGGNDAYNMVLATDSPSWTNYTSVRNQAPESIALLPVGTAPNTSAAVGSPDRLGGVLALNPINAQGRSFAVHPLMPGVRDLFNAGRLAIVPNVGPLVRPTTKVNYRDSNFPKPPKLFSHNDQQSTWQALAAEGATAGWGGRLGDIMAANNSAGIFTSISVGGNAVWSAGQQVLQYQVSTNGAIRVGGTGTTLFGSTVALNKMRAIMRTTRTNDVLAHDHATVVGRAIDAETSLTAALPAPGQAPYGTPPASGSYNANNDPLLQYDNPLTGALASNGLARQLQIVARMIGARSTLGAKRQVFFVSMGGFDTHDAQNRTHAALMAQLSQAMSYFDATLAALGVQNNVTTFTASDFGRTFTSNGDGTDHGWGSHHFVMGGAVRGRDLYGTFPQYGLSDGRGDFTSVNQIGNGAMLPEVSVDQMGATLGRWFGLSDAMLLDIFPNLANFDVAKRNLGFLV